MIVLMDLDATRLFPLKSNLSCSRQVGTMSHITDIVLHSIVYSTAKILAEWIEDRLISIVGFSPLLLKEGRHAIFLVIDVMTKFIR